jgi:serine/threonine protein phosphatase PrpC
VERHWDGSDAEGSFKEAFEALNSAVCEHLRAASGRHAASQSAPLETHAAAVTQASAAPGLADGAGDSVRADAPATATAASRTGAHRGSSVPVCTGIAAPDAVGIAAASAEGGCTAAASPHRWWASGSSAVATLRAAGFGGSAGKAGSKAHNPFAASLNRVLSSDGGFAASPAGAGGAGPGTPKSPSPFKLPVSDHSRQLQAPAEAHVAAASASESTAEPPRLDVFAAPVSSSPPPSCSVSSAAGCGGGDPADFDGCAALAVFLQGLTATVAGVGDCKAVLVRADGLHECVNTVHTANLPKERSRILAAGGTVSHDGRVCGSLNFTRSLGDLRLKARGVTCEPSVRQLLLQPHRDLAIVLATDGIWEVLDDALVARIVLNRGQFSASAVSEPLALEAGAAQLRPGFASQPIHSGSGRQATSQDLQAASAHFTFPTPLPTPPSQLTGVGGGGSGLSCVAEVVTSAPPAAQSKPQRHHAVSDDTTASVCVASSADQAGYSPVGIPQPAQWPTSTTSVGTASEASVSSTGSVLAAGVGGLPTPQLAEPRTIAERILAEAQLRGAQDNMLVLVIDLTRPAGAALSSPPISA